MTDIEQEIQYLVPFVPAWISATTARKGPTAMRAGITTDFGTSLPP